MAPAGDTTYYVYDDFGRVDNERIVLDGVDLRRLHTYDANGNLIGRTDRNGISTTYGYDNLGRLISENSTGYSADYQYFVDGSLKSAGDLGPNGQTSYYGYTYDSRGFIDELALSNSSAPGIHRVDLQHDNRGRQVGRTISNSTSGLSVSDSLTYDRHDRVDSLSQTGGSVSSKAFNFTYHDYGVASGGGNLSAVFRFEDESYINSTDTALGSYLAHTFYNYDPEDRLIGLEHFNGLAVIKDYELAYKPDGQLHSVSPPLNDLLAGDSVSAGQPSVFDFDAQGQLESVHRDGLVIESFTYDVNGNRISSAPVVHDRVLRDASHQYEYDLEGNVVSQTDFQTAMPEDNTLRALDGTVIGHRSEWSFDQEVNVTEGSYRLRIQPITLTHYVPGAEPASVRVRLEAYDGTGATLSSSDLMLPDHDRTLAGGATAFGEIVDYFDLTAEVDKIKLIVSIDLNIEVTPPPVQTVEFSGQVFVDREVPALDFSWDHRNRLVHAREHSASGNLVAIHDYHYDVFDQLVGRKTFPVTQNSDGDNAVATAPSRTQSYLSLDNQRVAEYHDQALAQLTTYSPHEGGVLSVDDKTLGSSVPATQVFSDPQGTPRDFLLSSGLQRERDYTSFGEPVTAFEFTDPASAGFQGMVYDRELAMYYADGRWYNPRGGRYVSEDSSGHLGGANNLYQFAGNTPVDRNGAAASTPYRGGTPSFEDAVVDSFDPNERALGISQVAGGLAEVITGFLLAPASLGGSLLLVGRGVDDVITGWQTAITGEFAESYTAQGVRNGLTTAGVDETVAQRIAGGIDLVSRVVSPAAAGALGRTASRLNPDLSRAFQGSSRFLAQRTGRLSQAVRRATTATNVAPKGLTALGGSPNRIATSSSEIQSLVSQIKNVDQSSTFVRRAKALGFTDGHLAQIAGRIDRLHASGNVGFIRSGGWIDDTQFLIGRSSAFRNGRIRHELGHLLDDIRSPGLLAEASSSRLSTLRIFGHEMTAFGTQLGRFNPIRPYGSLLTGIHNNYGYAGSVPFIGGSIYVGWFISNEVSEWVWGN